MCICGGMELIVIAAISTACAKCGEKKEEKLISLGLNSKEVGQSSSKVPEKSKVSAQRTPGTPCDHTNPLNTYINNYGKQQRRCGCGQWLERPDHEETLKAPKCSFCPTLDSECEDCHKIYSRCGHPEKENTDFLCEDCEWYEVAGAGRELREPVCLGCSELDTECGDCHGLAELCSVPTALNCGECEWWGTPGAGKALRKDEKSCKHYNANWEKVGTIDHWVCRDCGLGYDGEKGEWKGGRNR